MSVTDIEDLEASGGLSAEGGRQWTLIQRVKTDSRTDGPATVLTDSRLTAYLESYSFNNEVDEGAFRTDIKAKLQSRDGSTKMWIVTSTYQTRGLRRADTTPGGTNDPTLLPPEISGDWVKGQDFAHFDKDGAAITNSAGGPLGETPTKDRSWPSLIIGQYYSTINLEFLRTYIDTVNSDTFWDVEPGYWKLDRAPWQQLFRGDYIPYFKITYEFLLDKNKWKIEPLDTGPFDSAGVPFEDSTSGIKLLGVDGPLDGQGAFKAVGEKPAVLNGLGGSDGPFYPYEEKDFALLGIPTSL